jgi:hypothetical protein
MPNDGPLSRSRDLAAALQNFADEIHRIAEEIGDDETEQEHFERDLKSYVYVFDAIRRQLRRNRQTRVAAAAHDREQAVGYPEHLEIAASRHDISIRTLQRQLSEDDNAGHTLPMSRRRRMEMELQSRERALRQVEEELARDNDSQTDR